MIFVVHIPKQLFNVAQAAAWEQIRTDLEEIAALETA